MEKEDIISVQRAQEDVETSYNLLNNNIVVNTLDKDDKKDNKNNNFLLKEKGIKKETTKSAYIHASIDMCWNTAPKPHVKLLVSQ